jgi:hypothetical protein
MPDFRSARSESPEGKGIAKRAWDVYAAGVGKVVGPAIEPAAEPLAREWVVDQIGFWMVWHLYGGFEGLERFGFHRATIYRKIKRFRTVFGQHPDEFTMPGVTLDPEAYWVAEGKKVGPVP